MKTFITDKKTKLSVFLLEKYDGTLSYSGLCKLLRKKDIKVNGKRVNEDAPIEAGSEITVYYDGNRDLTTAPEYEDENILVFNKKAGITSEDFFELVKKSYPSAKFVHRLDRNTSGLTVFGLTEEAEKELLGGFKQRTFNKYYKAEVYGFMPKKEDVLNAYLIKDSEKSEVKIFKERVIGSVPISTGYKVLEEKENSSILEVELLTGRTHQIRAHLAFIGHFVIGDGKYGKETVNKTFNAKEQRLQAYKIIFHFKEGETLFYLDGKTFEI